MKKPAMTSDALNADPSRPFRKRKPLVFVMCAFVLAFAGFFGYLIYVNVLLAPVLNYYFIGAGLSLVLIFILIPHAEEEKPLGVAAIIVSALAFAFILYSLILDYELQLASTIETMESGGTIALSDFLVIIVPFLLLVPFVASIVSTTALSVGVAKIKPTVIASVASSPAEAAPVVAPTPIVVPAPVASRSPAVPNGAPIAEADPKMKKTLVILSSVLLGLIFAFFVYELVIMIINSDYFYTTFLVIISLLLLSLAVMLFALKGRPGHTACFGHAGAFGIIISISFLYLLVFSIVSMIQISHYSTDVNVVSFIIWTIIYFIFTVLSVLVSVFSFIVQKKDKAAVKAAVSSPAVVPEEAAPVGNPAVPGEIPAETPSIAAEVVVAKGGKSRFDGGLLGLIGLNIVNGFVTLFTLGIAYPWAYCRSLRWKAKHTVYDGYRLHFDGKVGQIIGKWILWILLSIVTIGIYGFWIPCKLSDFKAKHTTLQAAE